MSSNSSSFNSVGSLTTQKVSISKKYWAFSLHLGLFNKYSYSWQNTGMQEQGGQTVQWGVRVMGGEAF